MRQRINPNIRDRSHALLGVSRVNMLSGGCSPADQTISRGDGLELAAFCRSLAVGSHPYYRKLGDYSAAHQILSERT
jgi:hypothetical protein